MGVDVKQSFWRSVWNGYVFWTLFTSLPALIWFYPLNQLEISGYEAFIAVLLVPIVLRWRRVREYLQSDTGDFLLKLICIIGIASFRSPTTLSRLYLLTIGTGGAVLKLVCDLTLPDVAKKKYAFWGYTVGFMALLCTRMWYRTIVPAFNDDTSNLLVISVTSINALATIVILTRLDGLRRVSVAPAKENSECTGPNFLLVSIGAGSLFYVMHAIFGEVSTACRWVNGPWPDRVGPQPMPWGLAVYFALLVGFWISPNISLVLHPAWSITAAASFFVMYTTYAWGGFLGAILLAIYVSSVWPIYSDMLFRQLPVDRVGPAVALAMLTYVLEALYSVWTVAYNFVPGGEYTRESSGYLIAAITILISLGLLYRQPSSYSDEEHLAFTNVRDASKVSRLRVRSRFAYLAILACSATAYRQISWNPGGNNVGQNTTNFTAMVWTYHFGYDNSGWPSLVRTAKLIEDLRADVVGLLETDASRLYMGNNDLAQWLAETLNMYVDYGPNTRKHTWGSVLLSRFPILHSQHHLLPSITGELAPAVSALLNISGVPVGVVVTHLGNDRDDEDRKQQAKAVASITAKWNEQGRPVVFLGYVTSQPYSRDYHALVDDGFLKDIDPTDADRFCEYIFYNRLYRLAYGRISHGGLSDTEIQAAKFSIPDNTAMKAKNFQDAHGHVVTDVSKITADQRLPSAFGGLYMGHYSGKRHRYHMATPKFFRPSK